jgi:hypothetical protein
LPQAGQFEDVAINRGCYGRRIDGDGVAFRRRKANVGEAGFCPKVMLAGEDCIGLGGTDQVDFHVAEGNG